MELTSEQQFMKLEILNDRIGPIHDTPRFDRVPTYGNDVWDFFKHVGHLIKVVEDFEGVKQKILYTEEFGDKREFIMDEIITYEVFRRTPGTFENGPPGTGIKMRKPILLGTEADPVNPQYRIFTFEQWYDNFVHFEPWSLSIEATNQRVSWLENLFSNYTWYLEAKGYHFRYEELLSKEKFEHKTGKIYFGRPLTYWVRGKKTYTLHEKTIDDLVIELNTKMEL